MAWAFSTFFCSCVRVCSPLFGHKYKRNHANGVFIPFSHIFHQFLALASDIRTDIGTSTVVEIGHFQIPKSPDGGANMHKKGGPIHIPPPLFENCLSGGRTVGGRLGSNFPPCPFSVRNIRELKSRPFSRGVKKGGEQGAIFLHWRKRVESIWEGIECHY